ncbi:hypothetical protein HX099_11195 [Thiopseudomonas alkaliphila]|uniref:Phage integrase family protein n=1 Tax=Thiopseudomonas alkaliphila TaxID=1697053 RepID=A0AAW7DVI5_9GAMM|nr:hypothetical protein [Thiopseudomonas alkaliphila]MDM1697218.1 hypothetical protein [Thiopseudomonas alkaliphila]
MTISATQNWHENKSEAVEKMTVRLGRRFERMCEWAIESGQQLPLETGYHILGLNPYLVGIGNLVHELSHSDSLFITQQWLANPVVKVLAEFAAAVKASSEIDQQYSYIPHAGGAANNRRQFKDFQSKTFLLTLLTHPLADITDQQTYLERQRLRIWILAQAATRLIEHGIPADRSVSAAARFLILDADAREWGLIDQLVHRARRQLGDSQTFERYTTALANAADALKDDDRFAERGYRTFLNAIMVIAYGEINPIENNIIYIKVPAVVRYRVITPQKIQPIDKLLDDTPVSLPAAFEDIDEPTFSYIAEIDPTDSPAEQTLSSGSVYMQSMEMSHYLPWSWDKILPAEIETLHDWLNKALSSNNIQTQLGAACVWLAMKLGRSLFMVERFLINAEVTEEWGFSAGFKQLKRAAPRRANHWRPSETQAKLLAAPFLDELKISIPNKIQKVLQDAVLTIDDTPESLGHIWRTVSTSKLDVWFGEQARIFFPRITSSKLSTYQSQNLFDATGEYLFSRLLTSHPDSALPGACSYATWDVKAIEQGMQLTVEDFGADDSINVMGSLLTPLDSVLIDEIARCTKELRLAAQHGLITYHNALTQYVVTALYAATGARPLRDPFESLTYFSFKYSCVFINDKSDDGLHSGRLVPLPKLALEILQRYVMHLAKVADLIEPHRPELATKIRLLTQDNSDAGMPLFFLLDSGLQWHSMTSAEKLNCSLFDWGLPANLFRHRYSQQLLKEGVHPEVIEGWMGHAERGVATYSDYSARCWQQDAEHYYDYLQRAFEVLGFELPTLPQELPPHLYTPVQDNDYTEPREFGHRARERNRRYRIRAAIKEACSDIELFLNGRSTNELSDEQLYALGSRMLLRENRLPHPQAALRYRLFLKKLRQAQNDKESDNTFDRGTHGVDKDTDSVRQALLRQRLVQQSEERSLVTAEVAQAMELYQELKSWANRTSKQTFAGKIKKARALCVGTLLISIDKRISYQRMLQDLAKGQNFRIVQNKSRLHLEYSESLQSDDYSTAIQRHRISYKAASLLVYGQHFRKTVETPEPIEMAELEPLIALYQYHHQSQQSPTFQDLLGWICRVIGLANLVQLPGIVAAALSERLPPTSESVRDHMRLLHGKVLDLPTQDFVVELPDNQLARTRGQENDKTALQESAKEFARTVMAELQDYIPSKARDHAKNISSICNSFQGRVSPAILMLGYWMADLISTGKAAWRKKLQPYARNSLTTYWSSLAPAFRGLLYETDLVTLESDELTELCSQMLDYKQITSTHADFFGKRLQDFFRWAARFGVASPEWTELAIESDQRTVSSGLISEQEYQSCLHILMTDACLEHDEQLILGFVLLATYRFGLRAQEAVGLLRRDWCQTTDYTWVLVQNSQYRTLKSASSRRAIPLLFRLSDIEQDIIERTLARYQSIAGKAINRPILCEPSSTGNQPILTSIAPRISEALIQLLRNVVGNPELVLHHCRHSFYNRVAPALLNIETPLAKKIIDPTEYDHIRRIVLGPINETSRRGAMALARLMGHKFPSTGLKNYFHLATQWADELTPISQPRAHSIAEAVQLTELPTKKVKAVGSINEELLYAAPTLAKTLQFLRLVSLGMGYNRAGELMRLEPKYVALLQKVFETTNTRMRFSASSDKRVKLSGELCPNALLEAIPDQAWQRLLHCAKENTGSTDLKLEDDELRHLQELPYLISQNRQVLMEQLGHIKVIQHTLKLFQIPESAYRVIVKDGSDIAIQRLQGEGFLPQYEIEARTKLDGFTVHLNERGSQYQIKDYGGLILSRLANGVVRNGLELAVAILATGSLVFYKAK